MLLLTAHVVQSELLRRETRFRARPAGLGSVETRLPPTQRILRGQLLRSQRRSGVRQIGLPISRRDPAHASRSCAQPPRQEQAAA